MTLATAFAQGNGSNPGIRIGRRWRALQRRRDEHRRPTGTSQGPEQRGISRSTSLRPISTNGAFARVNFRCSWKAPGNRAGQRRGEHMGTKRQLPSLSVVARLRRGCPAHGQP